MDNILQSVELHFDCNFLTEYFRALHALFADKPYGDVTLLFQISLVAFHSV